MIHDVLTPQAVNRYAALHPLFGQALQYLSDSFAELSDSKVNGRHELDGDNLFVLIGDHPLKDPANAKLEVHDRYIDIQLVISGKEDFGWRHRNGCTRPRGEMDPEKDIQFFDDLPSSVVSALPREFVVFFPEDAHAPLMHPAAAAPGAMSRKAIVKVRV